MAAVANVCQGTVDCQLSELQSSEYVGQPNGLLKATKCEFDIARTSE